MGYYCLLMLLCSVIFAHWIPSDLCSPDNITVVLQDDPPAPIASTLFVSARTEPAVTLPGKS